MLLVALVRFLELRTVMLDGIWAWLSADPGRGEALGGVDVGAGNLDRADCTRCSSFCIFPIKPRICVREVELGNVAGSRFNVVRRLAGVANPVAEGSRECLGARDEKCTGLGVVEFVRDRRGLMVLAGVTADAGIDLSDVGGDGGV